MNSTVSWINSLLGKGIELLLSPFQSFSPVWGLLVISIISGIVFLFLYGWLSNQKAIADAKRKISGALLESILYRRDLKVSLKAQGRMFLQGIRYFLLAVPPILILAVPGILLLSQLYVNFGARPLKVGEQGILSIKLQDEEDLYAVSLIPGESIESSPPLRIPNTKEILWRLTPLHEGDHTVSIQGGVPKNFTFTIASGTKREALEVVESRSFWSNFLYAGKSRPPDSVREISMKYPEDPMPFFGFHLSWIALFAITSIVTGLIGSKLFSVEI